MSKVYDAEIERRTQAALAGEPQHADSLGSPQPPEPPPHTSIPEQGDMPDLGGPVPDYQPAPTDRPDPFEAIRPATDEELRDAGFGLKDTDLADMPRVERNEFDSYLLNDAREKLGDLSERLDAAKPPELPEVQITRTFFEMAMLSQHMTMEMVMRLRTTGQVDRYDADVRKVHQAARLLLWEISKAYGSQYVPPELPAGRNEAAE